MKFNSAPSYNLHLDLNSCFASIEQQANPFLRGKPLVVAAFNSSRGCILASSIEAKKLGIKTGMWVSEAQKIHPKLKVLTPDPWKYRNVHLKLKKLISEYTDDFYPKSIDEFVLDLRDAGILRKLRESENQKIRKSGNPDIRTSEHSEFSGNPMILIAKEIKTRIKKEIGDWLTISVGIAPNRYLAKIGAGLHKPDGLDEINKDNFLRIYSGLKLTDLTGIKEGNAARLSTAGIYSVLDFYNAPVWKLKAAFQGITGLYWHLRLSGYEADDFTSRRGSFGNSVALGKNLYKIEDLSPILARLTEKACSRLRDAGYQASGVHLALVYKNGSWWHKGGRLPQSKFDGRDIYKAAFRLLIEANPSTAVLNIAVSCFGLTKTNSLQMDLFGDEAKKEKIVASEDIINKRWGDFTIGSARSFGGAKIVMDRISFGGVKELEEFSLNP